jgi:hypothetical protein
MTHRPSPRKPPVPIIQRSYFGVRWLCHRFYTFNPATQFRPVAQPFLAVRFSDRSLAVLNHRRIPHRHQIPSLSKSILIRHPRAPRRLPRQNLPPPFLFDVRNFQPAASSAHPSLCLFQPTSGIQGFPSPGVESEAGCKLSGVTARSLRPDLQVTVRKALPLPVPSPPNLQLPELFHHHQRVKICALNPERTRHHAVRLEAKFPVKLPAAWIVDRDI